jgi:putative transposase
MRPHKKATHAVYDLKVHLIWITKYRYKVLTKPVGLRVRELIRQTCDAKDIEIIQGAVSKDHVHLYISYPPKLSVSEIVKALKGRSSRKIQQEFPHLQKQYWGRHFWAIGYAAFSSGHVTDEIIQEYIKRHDNHGNHNDDDFSVE